MFFDRESTVVITKLNNLSESVLTTYCQNFGKVLRCFIKTSTQTPKKDPCKSIILLCLKKSIKNKLLVLRSS